MDVKFLWPNPSLLTLRSPPEQVQLITWVRPRLVIYKIHPLLNYFLIQNYRYRTRHGTKFDSYNLLKTFIDFIVHYFSCLFINSVGTERLKNRHFFIRVYIILVIIYKKGSHSMFKHFVTYTKSCLINPTSNWDYTLWFLGIV